eukprot:755715-Pyramimonas_sp.AAC.1
MSSLASPMPSRMSSVAARQLPTASGASRPSCRRPARGCPRPRRGGLGRGQCAASCAAALPRSSAVGSTASRAPLHAAER